jgi:hypothetical protein
MASDGRHITYTFPMQFKNHQDFTEEQAEKDGVVFSTLVNVQSVRVARRIMPLITKDGESTPCVPCPILSAEDRAACLACTDVCNYNAPIFQAWLRASGWMWKDPKGPMVATAAPLPPTIGEAASDHKAEAAPAPVLI